MPSAACKTILRKVHKTYYILRLEPKWGTENHLYAHACTEKTLFNLYLFFLLCLLLKTLSTLFFMSFFLLLSLSLFEHNLKTYERVITNEKAVHTIKEETMMTVYMLSKKKSRTMFDCSMGCFFSDTCLFALPKSAACFLRRWRIFIQLTVLQLCYANIS